MQASPISRRAAAVVASACCLILVGCAADRPWRPFQERKKAAREREQYGPTADERIKRLVADAKQAKAGSTLERNDFTQSLAEAILAEHDPRVRVEILEIAAGFDTPAAAAICKGALEDPDERVRMAACSAWAKRGGPEAVQLLAARYQADPELDVRLRALRELGTLGDKQAIPVLARALEDSDPAVQYRAVAALKKVSGRDLGNDVNKWREWAADPEGSAAEWSVAEAWRKLF
jgi:HEAT repeat protein